MILSLIFLLFPRCIYYELLNSIFDYYNVPYYTQFLPIVLIILYTFTIIVGVRMKKISSTIIFGTITLDLLTSFLNKEFEFTGLFSFLNDQSDFIRKSLDEKKEYIILVVFIISGLMGYFLELILMFLKCAASFLIAMRLLQNETFVDSIQNDKIRYGIVIIVGLACFYALRYVCELVFIILFAVYGSMYLLAVFEYFYEYRIGMIEFLMDQNFKTMHQSKVFISLLITSLIGIGMQLFVFRKK